MSYVNVFDPSTELYGFQSKPKNPEPESSPQDEPAAVESPESQPPSSPGPSISVQEPTKSAKG